MARESASWFPRGGGLESIGAPGYCAMGAVCDPVQLARRSVCPGVALLGRLSPVDPVRLDVVWGKERHTFHGTALPMDGHDDLVRRSRFFCLCGRKEDSRLVGVLGGVCAWNSSAHPIRNFFEMASL